MPRVARPPRANHNTATAAHKQTNQSPLKIPLNDDRQEKAVRLQSRQALHDLQMNSLKAAASPIRKLNNYERAASDSPKTPRTQVAMGKENIEDIGLSIVAASAMTPMKRVPILANFEEWMKMATDNKINATNSWNFALIDYFHDMSLLKEGDGVNFQKASCTLDGCVKIYTSRVDSVATETGKLLSGLADSGNKKVHPGGGQSEDAEGGEDDEDEDGVRKKAKKRAQRSSEATLAPSFASLQLKKFELEFSVDPLFKKASADFDEGGAKGLLLNHLAIDSTGRIVFDSSDDAGDASVDGDSITGKSGAQGGEHHADISDIETERASTADDAKQSDIDIRALGTKFFPNLEILDEQDICPSLKNLDLGDPAGSLDIPFIKSLENRQEGRINSVSGDLGDQTGIFIDGDVAGFDEEDDGLLGGFEVGAEAGFGEGGEAWAKSAAIEPQTHFGDIGFEEGGNGECNLGEAAGVDGFNPDNNQYAVSLHHKNQNGGHEDILSYFDNALRKNWAGPEHWRIRRIKDISKASAPVQSKRKEKEPFEIDFASPLSPALAEILYTPATSNAAISLPKTQWKSKTRNLLPDDKHFNSRQLLRLFLKPKARMGSRKSSSRANLMEEEIPGNDVDEAFWARKENMTNQASPDEGGPQGNYDANFFQDDGLDFPNGLPDDDEEFADAREAFSPVLGCDAGVESQGLAEALTGTGESREGAFGTQLVTQNRRVRPEYMQYARVAKKVDVRRLKEEMWRGIGFEDKDPKALAPSGFSSGPGETPLKFTSVMNSLQQVYPKQAMADISTSYCFICLLHLANEKGLTLGNEPGLEELRIEKDFTAEIAEDGQCFSTTPILSRDHHFDTLKFVQRLKDEGFSEEQSKAMMLVLSDVIEESIQNLTRTMVLREDADRSTYTQKVDFTKLRSELLALDSSDTSMTLASHERLSNDLAKLSSRLRDEVNRAQASVRLDLNLEKGRIREEAKGQELKIKETETRIEQEVAGLRERVEGVKFSTLQWLM